MSSRSRAAARAAKYAPAFDETASAGFRPPRSDAERLAIQTAIVEDEYEGRPAICLVCGEVGDTLDPTVVAFHDHDR